MNRKVFISFLGTSIYSKCVYQLDSFQEEGKFIQNVLLDYLIKNENFKQSKSSEAYIFTTKKAKDNNWTVSYERKGKDEIIPVKGLKDIFDQPKYNGINIQQIDIEDGNNPNEIMSIFKTVVDHIEKEDEVYIDVTHGYRSIPLLAVVLSNYLKFIRNTSTKGIYYGAWEAKENREAPAPIIDLTLLSDIQDWTSAVDNFTNFGNTGKLCIQLDRHKNQLSRKRNLNDSTVNDLNNLKKNLVGVYNQIATNRGPEIEEGTAFSEVKKILSKLKKSDDILIPMQPLIGKIKDKISDFKENAVTNFLPAVKFCIDHGLIQQGITMLQEGIISLVLHECGVDYKERNNRLTASRALDMIDSEIPFNKGGDHIRNNKILAEMILDHEYAKKISTYYNKFKKYRNNINHSGFSNENIKSGSFEAKLKKAALEAEAETYKYLYNKKEK